MNKDTKKIIFFSSSPIGKAVLLSISERGYKPELVVTRPDTLIGRGQVMTRNSIATIADRLNIPCLKPASLKQEDFETQIKSINPDLAIVISYGRIIPTNILKIPRNGFLNIHPSLLPKYRGPSPIQSAILNGDSLTGVSIMLLDEDMDHGPILAQREIEITKYELVEAVQDRLIRIGTELLLEVLENMPEGKEQNHALATYTKKFSIADGLLSSDVSSEKAFNIFRALHSEPGCFINWQDINLKILNCQPANINNESPADSTLFTADKKLFFKCADGLLEILKIQKPGGKPQSAQDFINGNKNHLI